MLEKKKTKKTMPGTFLAKGLVWAGAALLAFSAPSTASAVSLSGDSSTYVQSRQLEDKTRIIGGYEYLDFVIQDLGSDTISFHTGGWLRYDFKGEEYGKRPNDDLQYSFLSFKSKRSNTVVNLGRVLVFEGVAAERVDGLYAHTDLKGGFGISAFGGEPVETNIDLPGNNLIYGARLSHQMGDRYRIGVSALKEEKNSTDFRKEGGVDLWLHVVDKADIAGRSTYNDITKGWMEHTYVLMLGPFARMRFDTTVSQINYDDYFYAATGPMFMLTHGILEPHEKVTIVGEAAQFGITDKVQLTADYKNFNYKISGKADYYGATIRYSNPESAGAGFGYHRMEGDVDALKYSEYRLYGHTKIKKFDVTIDLLDVVYVTPVRGVKDSYSASLAAEYSLTDVWKVGGDVEYSHNPDFKSDVRGLVKLIYHFGPKGGA